MKKLLVLVVGSAFGLAISGCGGPCSDLEDVCDKCPALWQPGCNSAVEADDSDLCEAGIDAYEAYGCK